MTDPARAAICIREAEGALRDLQNALQGIAVMLPDEEARFQFRDRIFAKSRIARICLAEARALVEGESDD